MPKLDMPAGLDILKELGLLVRHTNIGKILTVGGVLSAISHYYYAYQKTPADGDRLFFYFICDGTETELDIGHALTNASGKYDIYVNGVFNSGVYDNYNATITSLTRNITLSQPIIVGLNTIEVRVNGKNASSSNYYIYINGVTLQ